MILLFSRNSPRAMGHVARRFDHLRYVWQAFTALRTAAASPENISYGARVVTRRGGDFLILQRVANADIHFVLSATGAVSALRRSITWSN